MTTTPAGLQFPRVFTTSDVSPYDTVTWEGRDAVILGDDGVPVFEQRGVQVPAFWSQTATNIVSSKYFRGQLWTAERESSVWDMIRRVVGTIERWGWEDGYFADCEASKAFYDELAYLLLHQYASFNSPVWFNIGVSGRPQAASACFILDVDDSMESILEWYRQEGMIFKGGSGSGVNVSKLRGSGEPLSGGGKASGPLSWMATADRSATAIKSGGVTRRAARMVVMDANHPDIVDFIWCKVCEEEKAQALIAVGYDKGLDGAAYATVAHQSANHSVSVPDAFMRAVEEESWWDLVPRTRCVERYAQYKASSLMRQIAEATYHCGDPGLQFTDTINEWHTCSYTDRIYASNPCSEYFFLNNTACNLASLNLMKFLSDDGTFDTETFRHAVRLLIIAQEILVGHADYPTHAITQNSHDYRTLGLGYANLGALLMAKGLPYDSDAGRAYAAAITALMTGEAYTQSAHLAEAMGPFAGFEANREQMLAVMGKHAEALEHVEHTPDNEAILVAAAMAWGEALGYGSEYGYRNAQVTLLAPTGTIALMMDAQTTGVEPAIGLVSYKKLVGGGTLKMVNNVVPRALTSLGIDDHKAAYITDALYDGPDIATLIHPDYLAVFDCAFPVTPGGRAISPEGHIRMVAAVQPFLSSGVSKTINLPSTATVEDIESAYMLGWKLGCKSLAVYRDGCKATQPVTVQQEKQSTQDEHDLSRAEVNEIAAGVSRRIQAQRKFVLEPLSPDTISAIEEIVRTNTTPQRRRLPDERQAITHKFVIGGSEGYITVGLYDDGRPGEVFLHMAKEGSTLSGFADGFATMLSMALQYGVPLEVICAKFAHTRFEPAGFTGHGEIKIATSVLDYVCRWLAYRFLEVSDATPSVLPRIEASTKGEALAQSVAWDGTPCLQCGALMVRAGTCLYCQNCGNNSGCS